MTISKIKDTLTASYAPDAWRGLLHDVFGSAAQLFARPTAVNLEDEAVCAANHIGDLRTSDGKTVAILDIELATGGGTDLRRNRVGLRNLVKRFIDGINHHGILAVFHTPKTADWRFSFIAREATVNLATGAIQKRETAPKRFTYLLGSNESCSTAARRFMELAEKSSAVSFEHLEDAFSVEKLSKDFFNGYIEHYKLFAQETARLRRVSDWNADDQKPLRDFIKRLLGRLVFLYFLQKKGWLGCPAVKRGNKEWADGDPQFLRNLFVNNRKPEKFHTEILIPLFYETLNRRRTGDLFPPSGTRVPYLNGGLFEENESEKPFRNLDFPTERFASLFEFFSQFNFTIDENDPEDREIGVDPEMLGRIFEALLEENKEKGAYYTPKAIVAYMCRESLLQYLKTNLFGSDNAKCPSKTAENELEEWVHSPIKWFCDKDKEALLFVRNQAQSIEDALKEIKVCDPAIGSGAFPMGLLQEIWHARLALAEVMGQPVDSATIKKEIIQNSIYGVDLDDGAVDIARLRFWLSLVVDEDKPAPLPNLDYKIMQGNSLLESFEGIDLSRLREPAKTRVSLIDQPEQIEFVFSGHETIQQQQLIINRETADRITELMHDYFGETNPEKKRSIRNDIDAEVRKHIEFNMKLRRDYLENNLATLQANITGTRKQLSKCTSKSSYEPSKDLKKIAVYEAELREFDRKAAELRKLTGSDHRPYFLWNLFFHDAMEKGGFDIVIGNPPYVRADSAGNHPTFRRELETNGHYDTLWEKWDLYVPFIEKGFKLLKPGGVTTMIVSDAFCHAKYAQKSQDWFLQNGCILRLDFLGNIKVFDAAVHNVIYFFQKTPGATNQPERRVHTNEFGNVKLLPTDIQSKLTFRAFFPEDATMQTFTTPNMKLEDICYISVGMVINANEKVAHGAFLTGELISPVKDKLHPKPFVEGKNLEKWFFPKNSFLEWGTSRAPSMFRRPTFPELYDHDEKLMLPMVGDIRAAYDNKRFMCNHGIFVCLPWCFLNKVRNRSLQKTARYVDEKQCSDLPQREKLEKNSKNFAVKYLLAVMNSDPARFYLRAHRRNNVQLYPDDWKALPVPIATPQQQAPIVALVEKILAMKAADPAADVSAIEAKINRLVYALYGLTPEDIRLVEGKAE